MDDIDGLYPFGTVDGKAIPLDIVRPYGVMRIVFNNSTPSSAVDIPESIQVLSVLANRDCIIQFATSAAVASSFTDGIIKQDAFYVPADILSIIAPPVNKRSIAIIGSFIPENADDVEGSIIIQFIQRWTGLSLSTQTARR